MNKCKNREQHWGNILIYGYCWNCGHKLSPIGEDEVRRLDDERLNPKRETYEEDEDHDCHLVGGGGESGCDHPSHKESALMD